MAHAKSQFSGQERAEEVADLVLYCGVGDNFLSCNSPTRSHVGVVAMPSATSTAGHSPSNLTFGIVRYSMVHY